MPEHHDDGPLSADVLAELGRWSAFLGDQKRMSPKTLEAYRRDVTQFLLFMTEHFGEKPSLATLANLAPQDVRAFMAYPPRAGASARAR